jgi:hypothetical protein
MDLPNLLNRFNAKSEKPVRFLAVEISPNVVKSAVWQVSGSQTDIVSTGSVQIWYTETLEDILTAIDTSLADATAGLEDEPNEVIFGLPENWVEKQSIAPTKKDIIKAICQKLDLKPVGFVVTTEALVQYLKESEGGPPSGILIFLAKEEIAVTLIYLGKILGTQIVGRSAQITSDVEEGLARFTRDDTLPSRMILYNGQDDLDGLKQELISHDWQAKLPFLHFPKIESLPKDFTIKAVSIAGGAEVAKSLGVAQTSPAFESSEPKPQPKTKPIPAPESEPEELIEPQEEPELLEDQADSAHPFGFAPVTTTSPAIQPPPKPNPDHEEESYPETPEDTPKESQTKSPPKPNQLLTSLLALPTNLLQNLSKLKKPKTKKGPRSKKLNPLLIAPVIAVLLIALALAWYFLPNANVTLVIASRDIGENIDFVLSTEINEADKDNNMLPAKADTITVSDSKTASVTGTKTVGERAKGKVTLYNRTAQPRTLEAGTTLSAGSLEFTLDQEVRIASASTKENSDFSITTEPAKAEAAVTAAVIGADSNIASGTQLTVASFPTANLIAQAASGFSGGSSRQVQVVSATDVEGLKAALLDDLLNQISQQFETESKQQGVVSLGEPKVTQEAVSPKLGEEATQVSLSLTIDQDIYIYQKQDLHALAEEKMKDQISSQYKIIDNRTEVIINDAKSDGEKTTVSARVNLSMIPIIDLEQIKTDIKGKPPQNAQNILTSTSGFVSSEIDIIPRFPAFLQTYPYSTDRINLVIKPD